MNKKVLFSVLGIFLIFGMFMFLNQEQVIDKNSNLIYKADVCSYVTRADGEINKLGCSSNTLTNAGANLIKDYIALGSGGGAVNYIALCNATAGCGASAVGSTTLDNEFASGGLERASATYGSNGVGNWSMWKTFTAGIDNMEVNKTGIFNASSTGTLFAENTFTKLATLQSSDQITINWTISVSE